MKHRTFQLIEVVMHERYLWLFLWLLLSTNVTAQVEKAWPQFLGADRNGVSSETRLLESWPQGGPKEVWRVEAGVGMSGLSIRGDKLLTMLQADGQQQVVCVNAQTGETWWQTPVAPEYRNGQGNGPRSTPTIHNDAVLAYTGEGILVALKLEDGTVLWSQDVVANNGGQLADYGMACSPLAVEDQVIVIAGVPQATVVAYSITTGDLAWTAGEGDAAGYSSPAVLHVAGTPQVVAYTGSSLLGLAPQSGQVLWRFPYETDYDCNIAVPVAVDGKIFISSGESHGCVLLELTPDGDRFQPTEVWSSYGQESVMRNEWQTSVLVDGYLYGFDNVGGAGPISHLTCIDAATGERAWQQYRFGKGNLIAADGKLFMSTIKGELIIAKVSPKQYEELGRATVLGATRQAPSLANGLLYLRDDRQIVCLDARLP